MVLPKALLSGLITLIGLPLLWFVLSFFLLPFIGLPMFGDN